MQSSKTRYANGVPSVNERYVKRVRFLSKNEIEKGKALDLGAAPPVQNFVEYHPGQKTMRLMRALQYSHPCYYCH